MERWDDEVLSSGLAGHTERIGGITVLQHPGIGVECSAQQKGAGPRNLCGLQDIRGDSQCSSGLGTGLSGFGTQCMTEF